MAGNRFAEGKATKLSSAWTGRHEEVLKVHFLRTVVVILTASPINRILYSDDCLNVLNDGLALPTGSVDLIYLDPPFNSKSIYNLPFVGKDKDTRPVEAFNDTWTWGTQEDDLLRELNAGPQSRILADIISLAQRLDTQKSGGLPRT